MVSSVAARAGELVAAVLLAGVALVAVMAAGVWRVRRRLEVLRPALARRARGAAVFAGGAGSRWLWSLPLPDGRWREGSRARRELWRAVGVAEHAVAAARRGGAPTGDLDGLCRRLRRGGQRRPFPGDRAAARGGQGGAGARRLRGQRPGVGCGADPGRGRARLGLSPGGTRACRRCAVRGGGAGRRHRQRRWRCRAIPGPGTAGVNGAGRGWPCGWLGGNDVIWCRGG
jgi:hypothetical protein